MSKVDKKARWQKDVKFYTEIWTESNRKCQISGKYLGNEPLSTFFHHILAKTRFPEYRYCKWNILLVHPEIHNQIEMDIDRVPKARELYEDLMRRYENGELLKCE